MKEDKGVLITIIVLLIIFLPLTILGYIEHDKMENNYDHKLYYQGYLWFYDNDKLIGKYKCNSDTCDLAPTTIKDDEYDKRNYRGDLADTILPINNKYAFIKDGDKIILYDITTNGSLASYRSVNNYNTKIVEDLYIIEQENGKFGVLKFANGLESVIPFEYDFIRLTNNLNENNELIADYFLVKQDNDWFVIDNQNEVVSKKHQSEIIDYRIFDKYIAIITNGKIDIYNINDDNLKYSKNINTDYETIDFNVTVYTTEIITDNDNKEIIEFNKDI